MSNYNSKHNKNPKFYLSVKIILFVLYLFLIDTFISKLNYEIVFNFKQSIHLYLNDMFISGTRSIFVKSVLSEINFITLFRSRDNDMNSSVGQDNLNYRTLKEEQAHPTE